jgi:hypothetical protein
MGLVSFQTSPLVDETTPLFGITKPLVGDLLEYRYNQKHLLRVHNSKRANKGAIRRT